ncbi:MAG: transcriptional regulator GcvA [Maritimibacter sp.]|nr:transcriptional regulator GcvA [Maritimibacter sp.]
MPDRLPPLTALRAFDAAARHMSFQAAAAELGVTPAALSFQIKTLEEHLGQKLFRRLNRAVELTEAGRALAPGTRDGFEALGAAWRQAKTVGAGQVLNVTAGPAFTSKWLAPRMFRFAQLHPEIELRFVANLRLLDIERDEIDVAIRFGYPDDAGLLSIPLMHEWFSPMMTPDLAARYPEPSMLPASVLMHQDDIAFLDPPCDWPSWFRAAGLAMPAGRGPHFSHADHALDAALSGAGVILGRASLAAGTIADGALVAPYDVALTTEAHYRLLAKSGADQRPEIRAFIDWIVGEIEGARPAAPDFRYVPAAEVAR